MYPFKILRTLEINADVPSVYKIVFWISENPDKKKAFCHQQVTAVGRTVSRRGQIEGEREQRKEVRETTLTRGRVVMTVWPLCVHVASLLRNRVMFWEFNNQWDMSLEYWNLHTYKGDASKFWRVGFNTGVLSAFTAWCLLINQMNSKSLILFELILWLGTLNAKITELYLNTQSVPRGKHIRLGYTNQSDNVV